MHDSEKAGKLMQGLEPAFGEAAASAAAEIHKQLEHSCYSIATSDGERCEALVSYLSGALQIKASLQDHPEDVAKFVCDTAQAIHGEMKSRGWLEQD